MRCCGHGRLVLIACALVACSGQPAAPRELLHGEAVTPIADADPEPRPQRDAEPERERDPEPGPRCEQAGGTCVGPAAIRNRPAAPCPIGMHRVDDVALDGEPAVHPPACFGIPLGEEACCLPDL